MKKLLLIIAVILLSSCSKPKDTNAQIWVREVEVEHVPRIVQRVEYERVERVRYRPAVIELRQHETLRMRMLRCRLARIKAANLYLEIR